MPSWYGRRFSLTCCWQVSDWNIRKGIGFACGGDRSILENQEKPDQIDLSHPIPNYFALLQKHHPAR